MTPEEIKALIPTLREDQQKAIAAYAEVMDIILASKEPLGVAMFWVGEADLLNDVPVTWISNLSKESLLHYMERGVVRIKKSLTQGN